MPKHYRPSGKKKEGNAAKYVTRSQAVKYLQVSLSVFRKLCILKGVIPREPKKKVKGSHHSYFHMKDIMFLKHEPLLEKLRDIRVYEKKVKKAMSKKNRDLAKQLLTRMPSYTLGMLIKERYPKFIDALRDLDDCLSMVHLVAALPAVDRSVDGQQMPVNRVHNCRRLSYEWQAYISRTHKLRKTFISVKGIYYQAEVEGQKITWLTPHALQQVLPEVDYRVLLTFLEFYETLLAFVNYKLYNSINVKYPPIPDPELEAQAADLYAMSRYFDVNAQIEQLPPSEPGASTHLIGDAANDNGEDLETQECKNLFKNMKFFLSREVPSGSLLFVITAFGGSASWEVEGAPLDESDQSITYQVVDRPTQGHKFLSREYVQPQWVFDCVNARIILPTQKYMVGCVPPPHLSPFVDNVAEGYVPEYAKTIEQLKVVERKEVLPMPDDMGIEDLGIPQYLLDIIDRAEAIEAAKDKQKEKMSAEEKLYHKEVKLELEGGHHSHLSSDGGEGGRPAEGDNVVRHCVENAVTFAKVSAPRKFRNRIKGRELTAKKKSAHVRRLRKRKRKIEEAQQLA